MSTVFIINHSVENCGVYQYGKRFANIFIKSTNYNVVYLEINDVATFENEVEKIKPNFIIYNHLTGTLPWVTEDLVKGIRSRGIKQGNIVHNVGYSTYFDFYLHQDPNYKQSQNNYRLLRPLFDYTNDNKYDDSKIKIGSFGFGFKVKYYDQICRIINDQFNVPVEINLHLTHSHFCENSKDMQDIISNCKSNINKNNITLNISTNFLSDKDMLDFLHKNDVNIFFYNKYNSYNGISSVIDYALSVKKPIVINKSNMFSHIWNVTPSICIEDNNINTILRNGTTPLNNFYFEWNNDNFIKNIEDILENEKH